MLNIDGPGSVVEELERQTRINEDVIRYMTIRVDEHEEGPSVMMRKNERDAKKRRDREERTDGPPVFPPPQVLPVLGQERPDDRLQGRAPAAGLHVRTWQDRPQRITAVSAKKQRELAKAIKRARHIGLLPYIVK